jgi:phosphoribosylglycinamide formyltransferase-1
VRPEMDDGPILAQAAVPVAEGDTPEALAARVLSAEHKLYPLALSLFAADQIKIDGESVRISGTINQEQMLLSLPL